MTLYISGQQAVLVLRGVQNWITQELTLCCKAVQHTRHCLKMSELDGVHQLLSD